MAKSDKEKDPVEVVNEAEKLARESMQSQVDMWREASNAMQNKLPVTDPYMPNITVGRLAADMETIVPRDVQALLGERPYMPFEAVDQGTPAAVEYAGSITDQVDWYTTRGGLYTKFADAMRIARPLGIVYIEPRHAMTPVSIYQEEIIRDVMGRPIEVREFREETVEEGVDFRVIHPVALRPHPYGNSLNEKPEICVVELVHVKEIERLLDSKGSNYKMPDGKKKKDLRDGMGDNGEWQQQIRRDKGNLRGEAFKDIGVLIRHYTDDRWIHTWNRQFVLMDTENQNENMPSHVKPFAAFRNMSHITQDTFWPRGDYEFMMDLYWLGDMWLNMYAQAAQMYSAQWILYDPDKGLRAEDLKAIPGARIPISGGNFSEAVQSMKVGTPPEEYLEFYRETTGIADNRIHVNDWVAGRDPQRKETATAVDQLTSAGMTAMEFGITYMEQGGLTDLAYLTSKLVAANQTDAQRGRILGYERAARMRSADAEAIPGGYRLAFRGSDRVQRQQRKIEKVLQAYNLIRMQGTVMSPWLLDRMVLETLEVFDGQQLDDLGLTAEAQGQMAQGMPGMAPGASVGATNAVQDPSTVGMGQPMGLAA